MLASHQVKYVIRVFYAVCRRALPLLFLVTMARGALLSQYRYDRQADAAFDLALREYQDGRYADATRLFDSLAHTSVVHQKSTASYLMEAKALFHQNDFERSLAVVDSLEQLFPGTSYRDDIQYTRGIDYMMLQNHARAGANLLQVAERSADTALVRKSDDLLGLLINGRMSVEELERLLSSAETDDFKDRIAARLVAAFTDRGEEARAQVLLRTRLAAAPTSKYRSLLLRAGDQLHASSHMRIGVVLPLMTGAGKSGLSSIAGELLDGLSVALKEFTKNLPSTTSITLDVRDDSRDSVEALKAVTELGATPDVVCVIGPLFSNLVSAAAPIANRDHLPLITPTATTTGLSSTGPYVFQASPDYEIRGRALAQYAVGDMGLKTFAVLRTNEPMGASAVSFSSEVAKLGGTVVASDTFSPGVSMLEDQCVAIRRAVLHNERDAQKYDIPVQLDGLYIAIDDPDEINIIIPQLSFFNIRGTLLGNNEWYDESALDAHRKDLEGLTFVSDTYLDNTSAEMRRFRSSLGGSIKPTKYHAIGYDVMRMILAQTDKGVTTREELRDRLSKVSGFRGLHSSMSFDVNRVNTELHILQYHRGQLEIQIQESGR